MDNLNILVKITVSIFIFIALLKLFLYLWRKLIPQNYKLWFEGIRASSPLPVRIIFWLLPFVILLSSYSYISNKKYTEDPNNRSLPAISKIVQGAKIVSTKPDRRSGKIPLWQDSYITIKRLAIGITISSVIAYFFGTCMGLFPVIRNLFYYFITAVSKVPPITILPILFIYFGVGELTKIIFIALGTIPVLIIDSFNRVKSIPHQQFVIYETKGLSDIKIFFRVLKKNLPYFIDSIRNQLGPCWILLIAAESIAASSGLGYRIFFVRRMLAMDIIIPYLIFIVCLGLTIDIILNFLNKKVFHRWVKYVK